MTTEAEAGTVTYQGTVWRDKDYALDANGKLFQLMVSRSSFGTRPDYWCWMCIGEEVDWELDADTDLGGPKPPFKRVVIREP